MKKSIPVPDHEQWLVVYTSPRSEKKVYEALVKREIAAYCPLTRVKRRWSDRTKIIQEPLFRSYVFVHVTPSRRTAVLRVPGVLRFLYYERQPAVVRDSEIELIRQFLRDHQRVVARPVTGPGMFAPGTSVRVTAGIMMGGEGSVLEVRNNEVKVLIRSLGQELVASVDPELLEPAEGE